MIKAEVNKNHVEGECKGDKVEILAELTMLCRSVINEIADNEKDKLWYTSTLCAGLKFAVNR